MQRHRKDVSNFDRQAGEKIQNIFLFFTVQHIVNCIYKWKNVVFSCESLWRIFFPTFTVYLRVDRPDAHGQAVHDEPGPERVCRIQLPQPGIHSACLRVRSGLPFIDGSFRGFSRHPSRILLGISCGLLWWGILKKLCNHSQGNSILYVCFFVDSEGILWGFSLSSENL